MCAEKQRRKRAPRTLECGRYRLQLLPECSYETAFRAETTTLGFAFDAQRGQHALGSDRQVPFLRRPNSVAVTPAGCDVFSRSRTGGEYLLISGFSEKTSDPVTDRPAGHAATAANSLRLLMLGAEPVPALAVEDCIRDLWSAAGTLSRSPKAARWMTPARFARLTDLIEARLGEDLRLADLAHAVGVSESLLSRALSAYSGQTPHEFLVSRRLSRAREQLETTSHSMAMIAQDCGFSSHAHMSSTFRRRLGVTPSRLRQNAS